MLIYFLIFVIILVSTLLGVSVYYNYKFGVMIINVQESIEECLDTLDGKYRSISEISERPIFFDSVEIRQVVNDIAESRDAILVVAGNLVGSITDIEDQQQE